MNRLALATLAGFALCTVARAGDGGKFDFTILHRPLSKVAALNLAIAHNGVILQAQKDVEAAAGESIQLKAILFPHVTHDASYSIRQDQLIEANQERELPSLEIPLPDGGTEKIGGGTFPKVNNQQWYADVEIVQSVYEGGRMASALRSSRLVRVEAAFNFGTTVADSLLSVCVAYDDVIRTAKQVEVRDAAVTFLNQYLSDTKAKYDAGAVPEFDYIRQQVEVANAVAQQTQAVGDHRVAKQTFVELLGCNLPTTVGDDLPLDLTTPLEARGYRNELAAALVAAMHHRTELASLKAQEGLGDEAIVVAKAGLKPSVQIFAGYSVTSVLQTRTAGEELHGGLLGAQLSWPLFDGFLTKGKIDQAVALRGKTTEALAETTRVVELQVRAAWSDLRTARSVLEAQGQNVKKAERALELAKARYDAGSAPQIDVLSAQTALTDARGSYVDALRNYSVARTRLLRATGEDLQIVH